jgi:hypothetical protein
MAADYIFFQGKAKWVKSAQPNKFGNWSHDIYFNDESLEKFKKLQQDTDLVEGIKNTLKKDEDGFYASISRPTSKLMKGKVVGFAPPIILDQTGQPLVDVLIGNGSDITTKIEYYVYKKPIGTRKGSAIRWFATKVDNLIPFVSQRDFDDGQEKQVRGLAEQPAQPLF